eukprot:GFUD01039668.1.p1 GENE.GFUD01039668.1~~GFUD01039668.1.p1  ORF type:complete len:304 (+),score=90.29 GFUD01039668.1:52-912(+)
MSSNKQANQEKITEESSEEGPVFKSQSKKQKVDDDSSSANSEALIIDGEEDEEEEDDDWHSDYDDEDFTIDWEKCGETPEIQLQEIESVLKVWKSGKTKITETLHESEKLLVEIRNILVEARDVGKNTVDKLGEKTCALDEVFTEIQKVKDKVARQKVSGNKIANIGQDYTVELKGLEFLSFIMQAQCEVWTKLAFGESKRGRDLTKKSEDHERRILDLITSQKERLVYYEEMIVSTEVEKERVLRKMEGSKFKDVEQEVTDTNSVDSGNLTDKEIPLRKRKYGAV